MANIYGYSSLDEALSVLEENYNKDLKRAPTLYFSEKGLKRFINIIHGKKINSRNTRKLR